VGWERRAHAICGCQTNGVRGIRQGAVTTEVSCRVDWLRIRELKLNGVRFACRVRPGGRASQAFRPLVPTQSPADKRRLERRIHHALPAELSAPAPLRGAGKSPQGGELSERRTRRDKGVPRLPLHRGRSTVRPFATVLILGRMISKKILAS
jgi:hypothetical protein